MVLNPKQEAFCLEYAKNGNAKQAVIAAGYANTTESSAETRGSRMLRNDKVKKRLAQLAEETKTDAIADIQQMQERLTAIIRQQMQEEVIITETDQEGGSVAKIMKKSAAIKDVISAVNTLGKMQGCFIDRVEADVDLSPVVIKDDVNA